MLVRLGARRVKGVNGSRRCIKAGYAMVSKENSPVSRKSWCFM